ncbi:hypothetical protein FHS07_002030 [Microbacterium proteolyticum]|uniref:Uncharacterized protein n=1 Tax=Microbacterium proteolyticum TaxID=1572644 RepID=A0A7W5GF81_9MICO|nr:hypothetical protein [Microbacterium proteolyticum]MBB3158334.1 hypothetical protein [Microbacterium proteolyticum]
MSGTTDNVDTRSADQVLADESRNDRTEALSQLAFFAQYEDHEWLIKGFEEDPALRFTPTHQWQDPTGSGWTSESIINPTTIVAKDVLHLFYRASPRKESLASRIGHATYQGGRWIDDPTNPTIWPIASNEAYGVEDPKIYRFGDVYHLYYNAVFPVGEQDRAAHPSPGYPVDSVGCDISLAVSSDLETWEKIGAVTPREQSLLWAKGAVIPRAADGSAVKINGEYLMYVSEGFNGVLHVGTSPDGMRWEFRPEAYLDLSPLDGTIHEVATAYVEGDRLLLDFFYDHHGQWSAGQALYSLDDPFSQIDIARGGTLAWGGLTRWHDTLLFAQGWDAPLDQRQLHFYRSRRTHNGLDRNGTRFIGPTDSTAAESERDPTAVGHQVNADE